MAQGIVSKNTPKGLGADNVAEVPSSYEVLTFNIINQDGAIYDIRQLVDSFSITEELFSPVVVLNIRVRDGINFFEDFAINGQEKIRLELRHIVKDVETRKIDMLFDVKEYPNYQKTAEQPNIQEYNIIAVSTFAYQSMLQRISKSVKGNPVDNISKIFKESLNTTTTVNGTCVSSFDGIVTIQSPLKAIEWLRSKSFDVDGSPFFVFSNISEKNVLITSLSNMWNKRNEVFKTFYFRQFLSNSFRSSYKENASRILNMRSNIKLDKLEQAMNGAFASKTQITDIGTKTFTEQLFDQSKDKDYIKNSLSSTVKSLFSPNKSIVLGDPTSPGKSLSDLSAASISNISVNSNSNQSGAPNSSSGPVQNNIARAKSYYANMSAISHQISVYGDFTLNPGRKIRVQIPKAANREKYDRDLNPGNSEELDLSLSGEYIVAVAAHSFKEGMYIANLKIIKDA